MGFGPLLYHSRYCVILIHQYTLVTLKKRVYHFHHFSLFFTVSLKYTREDSNLQKLLFRIVRFYFRSLPKRVTCLPLSPLVFVIVLYPLIHLLLLGIPSCEWIISLNSVQATYKLLGLDNNVLIY